MPGLLDYLSDKYQVENVKQINERLVELSSLFEISQILNASIELHTVLNNILLIPMGRLMLSRGVVLLRKSRAFEPVLGKGVKNEIYEERIGLDEEISGLELLSGGAENTEEAGALSRLLNKYRLAIAIPLVSHNRTVGILCFGKKLDRKDFTPDEINFLQSLANISATSIENAQQLEEIREVNLQLDARIQQLKTLFDIAQGLSATLDSQKIEKLLTYALMGQMLVNKYCIVLRENSGIPRLDCKGFSGESVETVMEDLLKCNRIESAMLVSEFSTVKLRKKLLKMGACVFIPMRHQSKVIGFILLGEKINKEPFTPVDLEFLTTLVSQAVVSLENARLFQETLEKQRIEQELQVAKTIQKKLLPREIPQIEHYDVWGLNISSKEVGGDYFDVIPVSEQRVCLAIGDVSGKSVPASLLMANLQAGLRTIIAEDVPLDRVCAKLNNLIYQNTDIDKYITFFVAILDTGKHQLNYVNAGHNPPFVFRGNGEMELLSTGGIILGMIPNFTYEMGNIAFEPDDLLVCYTDGVNEAMNPAQEEFGEERLKELIHAGKNLASKALAEKIVAELENYAESEPQADDITLLIARRL
ncbi:MAG TPA: hypothetical protein ENK14_09475 [Caldithrix sp.]|nr:hypothetical protein [Caldithrix sp.]